MKKVLFLAIAALAYVSVNAQEAVKAIKPLSAPTTNAVDTIMNKVTTTTIMQNGVWDATNFSGWDVDAVAPNNTMGSATSGYYIRMTTGGAYNFQARTSEWKSLVGATWNSLFAGSVFEFTGAGFTFDDTGAGQGLAANGVSTLLADSTVYDISIKTSATAATTFTFQEYMLTSGETNEANYLTKNLNCGSAFTVNVLPVAPVNWKTTPSANGNLWVDNKAICKANIADAAIKINIEFEDNAAIDTFFIGGKLESKGAASVGSDILFSSSAINLSAYGTRAVLGTGILSLSIFEQAKAIKNLSNYNGVKAGVYTFTLFRATDNIANNSTDAKDLGILPSNSKSVDFAILPSPRPTLTTATIK